MYSFCKSNHLFLEQYNCETLSSYGKYFCLCFNNELNSFLWKSILFLLLKLIKTYQNLSKLIKAYQNLSKLIKTYQNLSKLIKTYQNLSKLIKTYQNLSKLIKTYQSLSKLIKTYQIYIKYIKTYQNLSKLIITYQNVSKLKNYHNVSKIYLLLSCNNIEEIFLKPCIYN